MGSEVKTIKVKSLRTFAKAWDFETVIYSIGDITLPFAVNITQMGFFAISLIVLSVLYSLIPPLGNLSAIAKYIVFPFLLMKAATKLKVDGKKPYMWIFGEIKYLFFQPKKLNRFRPYKKTQNFSFEVTNLEAEVR